MKGIYNNQSMNRDQTMEAFDIVEPIYNHTFHTNTHSLNKRPTTKKTSRIKLNNTGKFKIFHKCFILLFFHEFDN